MRLRIVVDTNVLIAALGWSGLASTLLQAARSGLFELMVSSDLLGELREKLDSPKFRDHLEKAGRSAAGALAAVTTMSTLVRPGSVPSINLRDPSDLHVLAAAMAGADIIVSRDKDLLSLGTFEGIPIISVEDCLHTLGLHRREE